MAGTVAGLRRLQELLNDATTAVGQALGELEECVIACFCDACACMDQRCGNYRDASDMHICLCGSTLFVCIAQDGLLTICEFTGQDAEAELDIVEAEASCVVFAVCVCCRCRKNER